VAMKIALLGMEVQEQYDNNRTPKGQELLKSLIF
jgi:hypothetical protein